MGKIEDTKGWCCYECSALQKGDYEYCVTCLGEYLRPIEEGYCPLCLDPRPAEKQMYAQCITCYYNEERFIDYPISCCYQWGDRSDIGFLLHSYKGSMLKQRSWLIFPLRALAHEFLKHHLGCINSKMHGLDIIVPIPGNAAKILEGLQFKTPVIDLLIDDRRGDRYSTGGTRKFDTDRFKISPAYLHDIPQNILLFDDVLTTGATANSAAYTLKEAGAKKVYLFTIAKHLRDASKYLSDTPEPFSITKCIFCQPY